MLRLSFSAPSRPRSCTSSRLHRSLVFVAAVALMAGCSDSGSDSSSANQCDAGAACLDSGSGAADSLSSLYGDQNSGPLMWNKGGPTVFDSQTGLLWQRDLSTEKFTWEAAELYCENLSLGGHSDWKLPHRDQLESIVVNSTTAPSIDTAAFPDTPSKPFWTRTLWGANALTEAYGVDFKDGGTGHAVKTESHFARCVRAPAVRS